MTLLFTPGPANITHTVKNALCCDGMSHRSTEFSKILTEIRNRITEIVGSAEEIDTVLLNCSGTGALEAMITSFMNKESVPLVIINGDYGFRILHIIERYGIKFYKAVFDYYKSINIACVDDILKNNPEITHVIFTHHETSTGMLNDVEKISEVVKKYKKLVLLDAISSFIAHPIKVSFSNVDAIAVSACKGMQSVAGLSFVVATKELLNGCYKDNISSFYLDVTEEYKHLKENGQSRFTMPLQLLRALHQALMELNVETVSGRRERYLSNRDHLYDELEKIGLNPKLPKEKQSNVIVNVPISGKFLLNSGIFYELLMKNNIVLYKIKTYNNIPYLRIANIGEIGIDDINKLIVVLKEFLVYLEEV